MLKNVVFNWLDLVVSTAIVLVLFPRLSDALGTDQYGVWLVLNAAVAYFSLLMLGVPLSTVRYITKFQAENAPERAKTVVNTAMLVYASMSLLVIAAGMVLTMGVPLFVSVPPKLEAPTRWAIVILTANCAATFPFLVFESILHAHQRFAVLSTIRIAANLLRFALTLLLVRREHGIQILALLMVLSSVVQFGGYYVYIRSALPGFEFRPWRAERSVLRDITGYSAAVLLFAVASRLSFGTDSIVIGTLISTSAVVDYAVGANFFVYLTTGMTAISQVLMPRVSLAYSKNRDASQLADLLVTYARAVAFLSILACGGLYFVGAEFIEGWMGARYAEASFPITTVLLWCYVPYLVQRAVEYPVLMATSQMGTIAVVTVVAAVANLGLSVWLAPRYGIEGVAWGTTIPTLASVVFVTVRVARFAGLPLLQYLRRAFLAPMATVPLFCAIAAAAKQIVGVDGLGRVLAVALLITVTYGAVAVLVLTGGRPGRIFGSEKGAPQGVSG